MPELESSSLMQTTASSALSVNSSSSVNSTLSMLLTLWAYADLNPALQIADTAEQERAVLFRTALDAYQENVSFDHGNALLHVLWEELAQLEAERAYAVRERDKHQALARKAVSERSGYSLQSYYRWVSHSVQDFFGSSEEALVEKYDEVALRREQQLAQLVAGIRVLEEELTVLETEEFSVTVAEVDALRLVDVTDEEDMDDTPVATRSVGALPRESAKRETRSSTSRRHLQSTSNLRIVGSVPDQIIQIGQPYRYSLNGIFSSSNPYVLGVTQAGQPLPAWLSFQPVLLSTYPAGSGSAQGVAVSGTTVFVADGTAGLQVLDMSNPRAPVLLSTYPSGVNGTANGVAVSGSTVFVADLNAGLQVLDVSNLSAPVLLSTYPAGSGEQAPSIAVSGSTVFVADGHTGLLVLDVNNLSAPVLRSIYPAGSGFAWGVAVSGSTVFVADDAGLLVLDVSNLSTPVLLSNYSASSGESAFGVTVSGATVFVADWTAGLQVLDVSNLSAPILLSTYLAGSGLAQSIMVSRSTVFVADGSAGLLVLDVSNLSAPVLLSTYPAASGVALGVAVSGSTVFIANNLGLQVLDVSQGTFTGIPPLSSTPGQQILLSLMAKDLVTGEILSLSLTLTLDNLPYLPQTTVSDQSVFPGQTLSLFLSTHLFSSASPLGLSLSLSLQGGGEEPAWLSLAPDLQLLSTYSAGLGEAYKVAVSGSTVFVAAGTAGLLVLDMSNPRAPVLLSTYLAGVNGTTYGVVVSGTTVFVANGAAGLLVLDVSNASAPVLLSTYPAGVNGTTYGVVVSGSTAFVADGATGLLVLDVSNLSAPVLLSTYPAGANGTTYGVAVSGSTIFIADGAAGLLVLDVSNASAPILLSASPADSGTVLGVMVLGSMLFILLMGCLVVVDVSNPSAPVPLSIYPNPLTNGPVLGIAVSGSTVFVVRTIGIQVLDMSNASAPVLLSTYLASFGSTTIDTIDITRTIGVAVSGSTVFVADGSAGLQVLDISQQTLTVTPSEADVGNYQLQLTATDIYGGSLSAPFTLRVEGPPQFHDRIPLQYAPVGQTFIYFLPQGLVTDPNGDSIRFTAQQMSQSSLPSWLLFNAASALFLGTPKDADLGTVNITINATDQALGSYTHTTFLIFVGNPIPTYTTYQQLPFNFTLAPDTFHVQDVVFTNYSVTQTDNSMLPDWLIFNQSSLSFTGISPLMSSSSSLNLKIIANSLIGDKIEVPLSLSFIFGLEAKMIPAQTATVGNLFQYLVTDAFTIPGALLNYTVGLTGGMPLPAWLKFNPNTVELSGTPGHGDTNFYAPRLLAIQLNASLAGIVNASTNFNMSVNGASWGELIIKVGSPIVSVLTVVYAFYKSRALVYNYWRRNHFDHAEIVQRRQAQQKYSRSDERRGLLPKGSHPWQPMVGERFEFHLLEHFALQGDSIWDVVVQVKSRKRYCARFCRGDGLLPLPYDKLSGGLKMPRWLEYDPENFTLRSKGKVPDNALGNLVVHVYGDDRIILKRFELNVIKQAEPRREGKQILLRQARFSTDSEINLPGSFSSDVEMQTLSNPRRLSLLSPSQHVHQDKFLEWQQGSVGEFQPEREQVTVTPGLTQSSVAFFYHPSKEQKTKTSKGVSIPMSTPPMQTTTEQETSTFVNPYNT